MPGKIGIIGSGLIGRNWSMIFASQAYDVYLYDVVPDAVDKALVLLKNQLETFQNSGTLRGTLNAAEQFAHIHKTTNLKEAVNGAVYIQVQRFNFALILNFFYFTRNAFLKTSN